MTCLWRESYLYTFLCLLSLEWCAILGPRSPRKHLKTSTLRPLCSFPFSLAPEIVVFESLWMPKVALFQCFGSQGLWMPKVALFQCLIIQASCLATYTITLLVKPHYLRKILALCMGHQRYLTASWGQTLEFTHLAWKSPWLNWHLILLSVFQKRAHPNKAVWSQGKILFLHQLSISFFLLSLASKEVEGHLALS